MKKYLVLVSCVVFFLSAPAQVVLPDASFGNNGVASLGSPVDYFHETSQKILPLADGGFMMLVNLGLSDCRAVFVKYSSNNRIDKTYGIEGYSQQVDIIANDAAMQADGKVVMVGYDPLLVKPAYVLARFNTDGTLDKSFAGTGIVNTHSAGLSSYDMATGVAISGSQIVVGGHSVYNGKHQFTICRFNSNGGLDISFGNNGIKTTSYAALTNDASSSGILIQSGKILITGTDAMNEFALVRLNTNGTVDNSFGSGGLVTTAIGFSASPYALALQGDKIVVAGTTENSFVTVRYNNNGRADSSFDGDGIATTSFVNASAESVVVRNDKIITGGFGDHGFALAQYNYNGSPDSSFNGDGKQVTIFPNTDFARSYSMALQGNKILMAGETYFYNNATGGIIENFAAARYNADGSIDSSFNNDGLLTGYFPYTISSFSDAVFQNDGKIVAVGKSFISIQQQDDFFVGRFNADGSPDSTFDGDGVLTTAIDSLDVSGAVAVKMQGDKILVAGTRSTSSGKARFALVRYNTDGSLDSSFGNHGKVTTAYNTNSSCAASAMTLQGDKILVAGYMSDYANSGRSAVMVARYNYDGTLDQTFSGDGLQIAKYSNTTNEYGNDIAVQGDKIVVAGYTYSSGTSIDFFVVRFNNDGTPDESFHGNGMVVTDFGADEMAKRILLQGDTIIIAGTRNANSLSGPKLVLAHYLYDGSPDTSYHGDGKYATAFPPVYMLANGIYLQDDGSVYVAGQISNSTSYATYRYSADGTLDSNYTAITNFKPENLMTNNNRLVEIGSTATRYFPRYSSMTNGTLGLFQTQVCFNTWTGAVDDKWENVANWSCGVLPGENAVVIIDGNKTVQVHSNVTIRSLQLHAGSTCTVATGYQFTITH